MFKAFDFCLPTKREVRSRHASAAKLGDDGCVYAIASSPMQSPPLDPDVADLAPAEPALTPYDQEHAITYLRMLDADAEGGDWREVSRIVLHIDLITMSCALAVPSIAILRAPNG
jgi:hypothetical protein